MSRLRPAYCRQRVSKAPAHSDRESPSRIKEIQLIAISWSRRVRTSCQLSRSKVRAIERAIVHSLRDVTTIDGWGACEVGDRPRDFQDAIVTARRQSEARHCVLEQTA